jgi:muramoyltetrapeptide carboxypeptidase LdcA involved in peptidoglycan recycling
MATIPQRLRKGDTIGVVSPSTPVTPGLIEQLRNGVHFLENLGFTVVLTIVASLRREQSFVVLA